MFITAALFIIMKTWKQSKCPSMSECIKKQWYSHLMEYYLAIRKLLIHVTWRNLRGIMPKVSIKMLYSI